MVRIGKIARLAVQVVSWMMRTAIGAVGVAVIALACAVGPPEVPPRIETLLLPDAIQQDPYKRDLIAVSLVHTKWTVKRHFLISLADGEMPGGQRLRAIGCFGRWLPWEQQSITVTPQS